MEAVIPAALTAAGAIFGAERASSAQSQSARLSAQSSADALAFAREQEENRRREYEEQQRRLDQYYEAEQARRAPFRAAASGVLARYGYGPITASGVRPPDWAPGGATGPPRRGMVDFTGLALGRERPPDITPPLSGYGRV